MSHLYPRTCCNAVAGDIGVPRQFIAFTAAYTLRPRHFQLPPSREAESFVYCNYYCDGGTFFCRVLSSSFFKYRSVCIITLSLFLSSRSFNLSPTLAHRFLPSVSSCSRQNPSTNKRTKTARRKGTPLIACCFRYSGAPPLRDAT